ncbi:TPA: glycosyltransferase family 2 protein [Aeromonas salmonicida]|nr:glycosyltransferase family 2 protein [Aeromonas salmonicida]
MIHRLRFLWRYRQNRYAHAMATATHRSAKRYPRKQLWAMYRLNMFRSVAQLPIEPSCWRSRLAKAVSLAACGESAAAQEIVTAFLQRSSRARHRMALAQGLAPFMPREALTLIEGLPKASPALHVALLLRNDQLDDARSLLAQLAPDTAASYPELPLLQTNAYGGTPEQQLLRLNAFLAAHALPPLNLIDPLLAPSPLNLKAASQPVRQSGPLISVLVTTFNTGYRAEVAVSSLLAQSHQTLELIVVDDASCDDTPQRLEALARRDSRIRLIRLPRNVGTYAAKRIGLAEAQGEFVTCHDSDDWSHPEKLSRQLAPMLVDPSLVCTVSNWVRMQDNGIFYARPVYPLSRLNPSSPLFRRERVLREAGAWDCVRTGADSEFLARLKLVFGAKAVRKVDQPLTLGSHRANSLMTAIETGYTQTGIAPQRQLYWEAWSQWHINSLAAGRLPFIDVSMSPTKSDRPFVVPDSLLVDPNALRECHNVLGID